MLNTEPGEFCIQFFDVLRRGVAVLEAETTYDRTSDA
jgi:hypothetical protein